MNTVNGTGTKRVATPKILSDPPIVFAIIPVFNRIHFTLACIEYLNAQTYPALRIIISDGGSTDGTIEKVRTAFPNVIILASKIELWWTGAMAAGIEYALRESLHEADYVLMMNNDTKISMDFVARLVDASERFDAAVGALIVDSRNPTRVLDAGEYLVWSPYSFPVKTNIDSLELFCDDVDFLPGRGSLIPIRMIRCAGNVDARRFPHYLADYEFFYRLKQAGFRLGVTYETRILAHIDETGILPGVGVTSFTAVWRELFSRRSMSNVIDHLRFVSLHAPDKLRYLIMMRIIARSAFHLCMRTPIRPVALVFYWLMQLPLRIRNLVQGQYKAYCYFKIKKAEHGRDIWCHPMAIPSSIRGLAYLFFIPGPIHVKDCEHHKVDPADLIKRGILRTLQAEDWFAFSTLTVPLGPTSALLADARNVFTKVQRALNYRKASSVIHATKSLS